MPQKQPPARTARSVFSVISVLPVRPTPLFGAFDGRVQPLLAVELRFPARQAIAVGRSTRYQALEIGGDHVCHRDHRAARGDLRPSERRLDGEGRGPGYAGLPRADRQVAVRGPGDLWAGGAGLL